MICTIYGLQQNEHEDSLEILNTLIDGHSLTRHTEQVFLDDSIVKLNGTGSSLRIIGAFL